jgi:hypothetical protein
MTRAAHANPTRRVTLDFPSAGDVVYADENAICEWSVNRCEALLNRFKKNLWRAATRNYVNFWHADVFDDREHVAIQIRNCRTVIVENSSVHRDAR